MPMSTEPRTAGPRSTTRPVPRSRRAALAAAVAAAALVAPLLASAPARAAVTDPVEVRLTAADVAAAADNRNGLTFKGFGVLSANSTSALLMDYRAQQPEKYWELVETLFGGERPIMNTIKIEMGNDRNTSTGPNAATMRTRDEYPNVQREPGFQLAADAQLVAEGDIHLSILRWARPTWVADDADQYIWFKNTVLAAYREYGVMVDSINPDTNETREPAIELYKRFSGWLRGDTAGYEGASADDPNNGFRTDEERDLYRSIRTVAADTVGTPPVGFGDAMTDPDDSSLRDAVDIVGFHYSSADDRNGNMTEVAEELDQEVWNSEGQSTFSSSADRPNNTADDEAGGRGTEFGGTNSALEMANWVTTGFAASRRTMNIFQPAIGSFYDGFQYSSKELVNAREPWSGWTYYDGGLAVIKHFTDFAEVGWENDDNTAGIWRAIPQASASELGQGNPPSGARTGGAAYTTLAAPDASDFSTVIVNDSSYPRTYRIAADGLALGDDTAMEVWETRAADDGDAYDADYLRPIAELAPAADGVYEVEVAPWSTVTATTLDHAVAGSDGALAARAGYAEPLPHTPEYTGSGSGRDVLDTDPSGVRNGVTDDAVLYADDFDYREQPAVPGYDPATGALVETGEGFLESRGARAKPEGTPDVQNEDDGVVPRYTNDTNGAFESVATDDGDRGRVLRQQVGPGQAGSAWNAGDPKTTIGDARWANYTVSADVLFESDGAPYATIGAREQGGTPNGQNVSAAELRIDPAGAWTLARYGAPVASGDLADAPAAAFRGGAGAWNRIAVRVAGAEYTASVNGVEIARYTDPAPQATGRVQLGSSFDFVQFDDLRVETVPGYTPYYSRIIDGMHQTSWDDTSVPVLRFDGSWDHVNGQGMFEWQRTASTSTAAGATMAYTFTGTGLDVLGTNSGRPTLDAVVDGVPRVLAAPTWASGSERTAFTLRGLAQGEHTVELRTANASPFNVDAIGVVEGGADSAAVDTSALEEAVTAVAGEEEGDWGAESWAVFAAALGDARAAVADPVSYGLDVEGAAAIAARLASARDQLVPKDVSPDVLDVGVIAVDDGGLPARLDIDGAEADITWTAASVAAAASTPALGSAPVSGRTTDRTADGLYQRIGGTVLPVPSGLEYFVDSGSTGAEPGSAYAGVRRLVPDLLNETGDRRWNGAADAGWGYETAATAGAAGDPRDWGSSWVGVDYGKPVTYRLTLPAGSHEIVAVQAPRPDTTTNVYTTVRAGDAVTTVKATSTGAATPVAQRVTLDEETVVELEFGTDGTSGYNGRLALVHVRGVPRDLGVQSALGVDDDLPATVEVAGEQVAVEWDADSAEQPRSLFESLTVSGTIGSGESEQRVTAAFEVVPAGLTYFIDAGTGQVASPQYAAVAASTPGLLNDAVDRESPSDDEWGYDPEGMVTKTGTDLADKYSTGLYQDTARLVYRLPLDAGTYTLTGGFTEWWGQSRTMYHTVSVGGVELAKGSVPLSGSNARLSADLGFTLEEPATVEYLVTNEGAGGERPVISWLAVADASGGSDGGVPDDDGATAAPGVGVLSSDEGWDTGLRDGVFRVSMNLWWGENASLFRLYRDGELVARVPLTPATPGAQNAVVPVEGLANGTYEFTGELVNSRGVTATRPLTVEVTDASPGVPVLLHDDWDRGGDYTVTANLWWGTNATSYRVLENGVEVASGELVAATPNAQRARFVAEGRAPGDYVYVVEFANAAGVTASAPVTVEVR